MEKLSSPKEIWRTKFENPDLKEAIHYATISLPWTFDRMHYGAKKQRPANDRLLHILTGVLNQTILQRELSKRGLSCKMDWTGYRESDIFDFSIEGEVCDVKTVTLYTEYDKQSAREPFSPEILVKSSSYPGPKWRNFFPVMVPMTQLAPDKEKHYYVFGVGKTHLDMRKITPVRGDKGFWCAVPFGKAQTFFHNTKLVKAREEESRGFFTNIKWKRTQTSLNGHVDTIKVTLYGEWEKPKTESLVLKPGRTARSEIEMSALSCIRVEHPASLGPTDELVVSPRNNFRRFIPKPTDPKVNINDHRFSWTIKAGDFVNLRVSNDYEVFWLGHISFKEFAGKFTEYPSYFIFHPSNPEDNTPGKPVPKLVAKLATLDNRRAKAISEGKDIPWPEFNSLIAGNTIKAGLLVCANRFAQTLGAACYYYPPYAMLESAIYILPRDLYTMDSLESLRGK